MSADSFTSVPWGAIPGPDAPDSVVAWHKRRVPYVPNATYLQTLDIWIPSDSASAPSPESLPVSSGPWVIYIHGGAWRDPLVNSSSFEVTAKNVLAKVVTQGGPKLAGLASLNYNLSENPNHPTDPAPPKDPAKDIDVARTAKHPEHIHDVLSAIAYLQSLGAAKDYILAGHSCGATLAFQVVMKSTKWSDNMPAVTKPRVLLGLNGLYDLPKFIRSPDESHKALLPVYDAFTRGAFGDDESVWELVSPATVKDWAAEWPEGGKVVLVQSKQDNLVPYSQLEGMKESLGDSLELDEMAADGDHNALWQKGDRLAEIIEAVLKG